MKVGTYNFGDGPDREKARDLDRLDAALLDVLGTTESTDRADVLAAAEGYARLQAPHGGMAHTALLVELGHDILDHGWQHLNDRTKVGRLVAGARRTGYTQAKWLQWVRCEIDGETWTIGVAHFVPSAGNPVNRAARRLFRQQAQRSAAWFAAQDGNVALVGDFNARPGSRLLSALRAVADPHSKPSHGRRPIDIIWTRKGADVTGLAALDGYSSDHRPIVADVAATAHKPAPKPKEAPVSARIDAVDLSHWQGGALDFHAAKRAGVKGVWHKATEGTGYVDPMHDRRQRETAAAGIPFGSYHFAKPGDAAAQAHHFLRHAASGRGHLRPMLDLEDATMGGWSVATRTAWVKEWVRIVAAAAGVPPVIYTRFDLAEHFDCPLWVARYSDAMSAPHVPRPWKAWSIWQFSNGAFGRPDSVAGIGHCDLNTFNSGVDIDLFIIANQSEEDDMQLDDDIWPGQKDNNQTVGDLFHRLDRFIDRQDARQKRTEAAVLELAKGMSPTVQAAVAKALEESTVSVDVNVHGKES